MTTEWTKKAERTRVTVEKRQAIPRTVISIALTEKGGGWHEKREPTHFRLKRPTNKSENGKTERKRERKENVSYREMRLE